MNSSTLDESTKEIINRQFQEAEPDPDGAMERITKFLLLDKSIPEGIAQKLWAFSDKEIAISNFNDHDILRLRNKARIAELAYISSLPPGTYDFNHDLDMRQMDSKFFIKVKRSYKGFERQLQNTQIRNMNIRSDASKQQDRKKSLGRIGWLFGRKSQEEGD